MERFRPKTAEELSEQVNATESVLGKELPQSSSREEILSMSADQLKEQFPRRYEIYLHTIRSQRSGDSNSAEELAHQREWLRMLNNLDRYIETHKADESQQTLREKQLSVFEAMRDFLEKGGDEGYLKLPTGVGKTVLFTEFLEAIDTKTLIAVPTLTLVQQTVEKLKKFAPRTKVGRVSGYSKEFEKKVTVSTYASLVSEVEKGNIKPEEFGLLILDEAHRSLSDLRSGTVEKFKNAVKLGFTATPTFSENKDVADLLNTEIYSMSIPEAVKEGLMCSFSVILARTNIDLTNITITGNDYSEKELDKIINVQSRNIAAVKLYKEAFHDRLGVAFCVGVAHAEQVSRLFNEHGIPAAVLVGGTKDEERILQAYKEGGVKVLCTAEKLTEGFDEQRASVCLNLRPTLSRVIAEQRAGRVLRLDENDPKKFAHIIEFLDQKKDEDAPDPITFAEIVGSPEVIWRPVQQGPREGKDDGVIRDPKNGKNTNISELHIEGLEVTTDPREVMRVINQISQRREYRAELAPEGWMSTGNLENELTTTDYRVSSIAEKYRNKKPEWFKEYLHPTTKRRSEYFAPELVAIIKHEVRNLEYAPAGWMTRNAIALEESFNRKFVGEIIDSEREKHPEWFKKYAIPVVGSVVEFLHPELVDLTKREIRAIKSAEPDLAPEGWLHLGALLTQFQTSRQTIERIAHPFRKEHPEWFGVYKGDSGKKGKYFAPELVEIIKNELSSLDTAPPGWLTIYKLAEVGPSYYTIKKTSEQYRHDHPEYFRFYRDKGKKIEHLAPELVAILNKKNLEYSSPSQEWKNMEAMRKEIDSADRRTIRRMVEHYRVQHPEWFKKFRDPAANNQILECFAPELVEIIKEELTRRNRGKSE